VPGRACRSAQQPEKRAQVPAGRAKTIGWRRAVDDDGRKQGLRGRRSAAILRVCRPQPQTARVASPLFAGKLGHVAEPAHGFARCRDGDAGVAMSGPVIDAAPRRDAPSVVAAAGGQAQGGAGSPGSVGP